MAVTLFEAITAACYRQRLTVVQYDQIGWPAYELGSAPADVDKPLVPKPNLAAIDGCGACVWLDLALHSPNTEAELKHTLQLGLPLLRVTADAGMAVVETEELNGPLPLEAAAVVIARELRAILSRKTVEPAVQ